MGDIALGIYVSAIGVCVVVYVFFVLRICKSENISLGEAFGFSKGEIESRPRTVNHKVNSYSVSVDEEINALYEQMNNADGEERIALWNRIQELKSQR